MSIRIALPSKGRISGPAVEILEKAGIGLIDNSNRKLFSQTFDPEITVMFTRAADIPEYVKDGAADIGITGYDLVKEKVADVEILEDLKFGHTRLVIAAPENSDFKTVDDLKSVKTVATEFPELTKQYFNEKDIPAKIFSLSGATEVAPLIGVADVIADLTSTGTTLKMNHLKIIDTILDSSIMLIANNESLKNKKELIESVSTSIKGVLDAARKKLIMMNVDEADLGKVKDVMPSMGGLTISEVLSEKRTVAVQAVIDEKEVFDLVNDLRNAGARDILVVPIERII